MNELVTDLKSLELETLKNLKNSKAANTLRAYQADFKDFSAFCAKNGLSSIPTEPKILSIYLTHLAATSKFSTLKRRIASISVSNQHASTDSVVSFKLVHSAGNDIYIIKDVAIPAKTTLVISGIVSFDNKRFKLVCSAGVGGFPISVIIR